MREDPLPASLRWLLVGFRPSWTIGLGLPSAPVHPSLHKAAEKVGAGQHHREQVRNQDRESKMEERVFL